MKYLNIKQKFRQERNEYQEMKKKKKINNILENIVTLLTRLSPLQQKQKSKSLIRGGIDINSLKAKIKEEMKRKEKIKFRELNDLNRETINH